jgi:hypothetical protein
LAPEAGLTPSTSLRTPHWTSGTPRLIVFGLMRGFWGAMSRHEGYRVEVFGGDRGPGVLSAPEDLVTCRRLIDVQ